jgi:UDP-N-acetylmuramoyl-tripeptide--D-alanyl-D-alanine ligase
MPPLSLAEVVEATGGSLLRGSPGTIVSSFCIDTRLLRPGGLFFALPGARTDGHAFLEEAARAGAAAAVVSRALEPGAAAPEALVQVEDPVGALGRCGRLARRKVPAKVVAVTGSTGKTTTKELIAAALGTRRRVHRTLGNLNNHLGVPLTLLACPEDAEVQVVEMGMSAPNEIAHLTELADPDVGLVTNVRPVHLEFFRSLDDIAAAKGELFAKLRADATAVVNLDDPNVRLQAERHAGPRVTYGRDPGAEVRLEAVEDRFLPGAALTVAHAGRTTRIDLRLPGAHSAENAVAALAAALAAGARVDEAAEGMRALEAGAGRGRIHALSQGIVVVDDAYNSNPAAVAAVLRTLAASRPSGRRVLVFGDMLELGREEATFHREVGRLAARAGIDLLVGVGARARDAVEEAARAGIHGTAHEPDAATAAKAMPTRLRPGDLVVVKGSRGVRLEKVVAALQAAFPPEAAAERG